jgi:hypothetical protein
MTECADEARAPRYRHSVSMRLWNETRVAGQEQTVAEDWLGSELEPCRKSEGRIGLPAVVLRHSATSGTKGGGMKSSALIPLVVLLVSSSGLAAQVRPSESPVSHFQGSCESDPDGTKFAEKACYTTYYPGDPSLDRRYRPPTCDKSRPLAKGQKEALAKMYSHAPDYLQARLCRLTRFFLTRSTSWGPKGWGYWEGPDRSPNKGVYLAISDQELRGKKSIADAHNETADQLLGVATGGRRRGPQFARLRAADNSSDPALTILGTVAHEMGHVLISDANVDGTHPDHPRRMVSGPPRSACFEDAFLGTSWDADTFHRHMRRWVDFADQHSNKQKNPDSEFNLERLKSAVRRGNFNASNDPVEKVYRNKEFVSLHSALAPEEDFAETYKHKVLADAMPNQKVVFRLGNRDIDMHELLESEIPAKKVQCLRDFGFLSNLP